MNFKNLISTTITLVFILLFNLVIFMIYEVPPVSFMLVVINLLLVLGVIIYRMKDSIIFDVINLFNIYYLVYVFAAYYLVFTGLDNNRFINSVSFYNNVDELFNITLIIGIVAYILFILGIKLGTINTNKSFRIKSEFDNPKIILILSIVFYFTGIINFLYNIYTMSGGNIFEYLSNVSGRRESFENQGTTVFYNLTYISLYFYMYHQHLIKKPIYKNIYFLIFTLTAILMKFSSGRITNTVIFILSIIVIMYFLKLSKNIKIKKMNYYITFLSLAVFGVLFYIFRMFSSYKRYGVKITFNQVFQDFFAEVGFFFIDKGNVPNIPVFMKIIDSWKTDIGFLKGNSFFSPIVPIIPAELQDKVIIPSVKIKEVWYDHIPSGALPPTAMGEFYANFGIMGIIIAFPLFGYVLGRFYRYCFNSNSFWWICIYTQVALGFVLIFPKGELSNLTIWLVLPTLFGWGIYRVLNNKRGNSQKRLRR